MDAIAGLVAARRTAALSQEQQVRPSRRPIAFRRKQQPKSRRADTLRDVPAKPSKPIQPDPTSAKVRQALPLLHEALDHLRIAQACLDEAAEIEGLPAGLAASFETYDSVIGGLRNGLAREHQWLDDKAELLFSAHSPLATGAKRVRRPPQ